MDTTRRGFLGMLLGAAAAGTIVTNKALAETLLVIPEDKFVRAVRLLKESITLNDLHKDEWKAQAVQKTRHWTRSSGEQESYTYYDRTGIPSFQEFLRVADDLCAHCATE